MVKGRFFSILFIKSVIPLFPILRKVKTYYEFGRKEFKINKSITFFVIRDLKLCGKNQHQISPLIKTLYVFNKGI